MQKNRAKIGQEGESSEAISANDLFRLSLCWETDTNGRPAVEYTVALMSYLLPICDQVIVKTSDGTELDDLDLDEVVTILRRQVETEISFTPKVANDEPNESWKVRVKEDSTDDNKQRVDFTLPGNRPFWDSALAQQSFDGLLWLQADLDFPSPLISLALPHSDSKLHPHAFHGLVALGTSLGNLTQAELTITRGSDEGAIVSRWHVEEPAETDGFQLFPVVDVAGGSLWLPQDKSALGTGEASLWVEVLTPTETSEAQKTKDVLTRLRGRLEPTVQGDPISLSELHRTVRELLPETTRVEFKSLDEVEQPQLMSAQQHGSVLVLAPSEESISIGLDLKQPADVVLDGALHGLGHVLLGHVRAGDLYGHSDTIESIRGDGARRRWDLEVFETFRSWFEAPPPRKIESVEDCTAQEKVWLGLWQMIGELLGESRQLHPKANEYQQVIYQRQAAQRLLAQLEEYGGAMLCDGVGLGKTYVATTLMVHYANSWRDKHKENPDTLLTDPFRITVLAPNSVVSTWEREAKPPLARFGVLLSNVRVFSHTKLSRMTRASAVLERPGPDKLSDLEHLLLSNLVIVDEAHNFRSTEARRTSVLRDLLRLQPRKEQRRRVLLLTATPVNNRLEDLLQEVSLLYSRPLMLSEAKTEEGYRRQSEKEILERCARARSSRGPKGDVSAHIIFGDADIRFSTAIDWRDDLDFGPNVQRIGQYLKEQDGKLKELQEHVRTAAQLGREITERGEPVRIADELLDRIVVQRSRTLCKEIESQQGSNIELLFRPDADVPAMLYYSDEYDGIQDVLARFLPLFGVDGEREIEAGRRPLSLKVYMWYDVREGYKSPEEYSPVVGLQRILILKRLESSPVSFLITLLRLTVLHAHRMQTLLNLCIDLGEQDRKATLQAQIEALISKQSEADLDKIRFLATGDTTSDPSAGFIKSLSEAYVDTRPEADSDDPPPQLELFKEEELEEMTRREQLNRLWELKDPILQDLETLLQVTPGLADIVFGRFSRNEWPRRFIAGGDKVDWPKSAIWGLRIVTDAKLRQLIARLLKSRRDRQKVILFSQFSDSLCYISSVLRASEAFNRQDWSTVITALTGLGLPGLRDSELRELIDLTDVITGDTEERDTVINAFAPFYRIGPELPSTRGATTEEAQSIKYDWIEAWRKAIANPIHVLLSSDVLAEGVNLQDATMIINFDIHWNPVRMIQRAGRIDRRLNPEIEKKTFFPHLEAIAKEMGKPVPVYYWHDRVDEAPMTVNMILPDELETELLLRERIAIKTLAIDFTLGLEQGTGAEAQWMKNYKYQGISSLNAFQKDRAIEKIASYREKLFRIFLERGISPEWVESLNGWFREQGAGVNAPLAGRATIGRRGGEVQLYTRYLEPELVDDVPHWLWSQQRPGESILNFWLALDNQNFPARVRTDLEWHPNASVPLSANQLLGAAILIVDNNKPIVELPPQEVARPLLQGITALSAGFLASEEDRRMVNIAQFFLLQLMNFQTQESFGVR